MRTALAACLFGLLLTFPAPGAFAGTSKDADAYFEVRNRAQLAASANPADVQTQPRKFAGKLVELRGALSGIAVSDTQTTLVIAGSENAPSHTVALPAGKETLDYPVLSIGAHLRVLCRVVAPEDNGSGYLEMRIAVKEEEAAQADQERQKAAAETAAQEAERKAAAARSNPAPRTLGSRGVGGGTLGAAARPAYSDSQLVEIYAGAVRHFNRRLPAGTARHIASTIIEYSRRYELDARLVMAVIACESNFNPGAVSPVGAQGLGQLMPGTAAGLGVGNSFDTRQNLEGSTRLLKNHIKNMKRGGRPDLDAVKLALACYNAGAGAVRKYKGIPPYKETQQYVKKITRLYWQMLQPEERSWSPD